MIERVSSDLENIYFHLKLKVFMTMLGHISDLLLLLIIHNNWIKYLLIKQISTDSVPQGILYLYNGNFWHWKLNTRPPVLNQCYYIYWPPVHVLRNITILSLLCQCSIMLLLIHIQHWMVCIVIAWRFPPAIQYISVLFFVGSFMQAGNLNSEML